ncbi:MAG: biotin carboxylase N-terminal domain-containing protein [Armatimonadota bacterium]|nr:biotin carboxylase N-terminal domain-containing protein [Armatimonadota bacterium]
MFRKVLVANRGEIARRVIHACRELGIRTVAVYSEADANAPFVREADEAYLLGGAPAAESYLNIPRILEIAQRAGVEAIHPGYGFLSENPDFAQACEQAGIVFIGPRAEVIRLLGDKGAAKRAAERAGVPVVPGYTPEGAVAPEALLEAARQLGFPVLLKAVAGGGGKGMRVVDSPDHFVEVAESAAREALNAFGDPRLMLERYLTRPRHIEVQILADQHGTVLHLNERECSIQRRHQKIIEESPSPALDAATRAAICDAAVRLAEAVGYTNAGTVEFLYEQTPNGARFYFLEVNTRLQVEHPVTEIITGVDLVHWQIRIAAGERLDFTPPAPRGHAIEARLYAEDPDNDFAPSLGTLAVYHQPHLPGVRFDSGVETGSVITHHYDPMIAKVIAHAPDRLSAIRRLVNALEQTIVLGVRTNQAFLIDLLQHPAFVAGDLHTGFLQEHFITAPADTPPVPVLLALAMLEPLTRQRAQQLAATDGRRYVAPSPWEQLGRWRIGQPRGVA